MTKEVGKNTINDYYLFDTHLMAETNLLENWFIDQAFVEQELQAGAEIEFFLLDKHYNPLGQNLEFIHLLNESFLVTEVGAAHLEINSGHSSLSGGCLSILHDNILGYWKKCCSLSQQLDSYIALIGSLPTSTNEHHKLSFMTDKSRYKLLNNCMAEQRLDKPITVNIQGKDACVFNPESLAMNGLLSAFQLHIQIGLSQSVRYYNVAQAIAGPMLALSANSPFILGYHLWSDTRIAIFDQVMTLPRFDRGRGFKCCLFGTGYLKDSFFELFDQNFQFFPRLLPEACVDYPLEEMFHVRRQNGVVYRWNRPVIDFSADGRPHLRIEHRGPSSGPTIVDMIANAAFFYGLIGYFGIQPTPIEYLLPFHQARKNFFNAARKGIHTQFKWFAGHEIDAISLLRQLLVSAKKGLQILGISTGDINLYLGIIERRLETGINGTEWQIRYIEKYGKDFHALMAAYLDNQYQELPVSEWPL